MSIYREPSAHGLPELDASARHLRLIGTPLLYLLRALALDKEAPDHHHQQLALQHKRLVHTLFPYHSSLKVIQPVVVHHPRGPRRRRPLHPPNHRSRRILRDIIDYSIDLFP